MEWVRNLCRIWERSLYLSSVIASAEETAEYVNALSWNKTLALDSQPLTLLHQKYPDTCMPSDPKTWIRPRFSKK